MIRMRVRLLALAIVLLGGLASILTLSVGALDGIPGTASLSGTVTAPEPFKAAQVHMRNLDKGMLYVVYTAGGRYQAINLLPGNYEVRVEKRGFTSDMQKVQLQGGSSLTVDFALKEGTQGARTLRGAAATKGVELVAYDQLYPPGPGRDLVERTCMACHLQNFLPTRKWTVQQWSAAVDMMMNPDFAETRDASGATINFGPQIQPGSSVKGVTAAERKTITEYLAKNFGPDSKDRALRIDAEYPLDEQSLSRAMFIEYFLPVDGPYKNRKAQDPRIDKEGNVWYTNYGVPNTVGKLDPRTGKFTDYPLPNPESHPHGIILDSSGNVFWAEFDGEHLGRLDTKTGKMTRFHCTVPGCHMNTLVLDAEENVYFTLIIGNKLGKWDRKTEKVKVWEAPSANSFPYGIVRSDDGMIWFAEFHGGKVVKFDPATEKFTEYAARSQPALVRRLGLGANDTVWFGSWNRGKINRLDMKSGEVAEYDVMPFTQPYDAFPGPDGQVWISEGGLGGALIRFDPQSKKSVYYPSPRATDMPKLDITRDGAVWYTTRSNAVAAVGVLYPDVSTMKNYAPRFWKQ